MIQAYMRNKVGLGGFKNPYRFELIFEETELVTNVKGKQGINFLHITSTHFWSQDEKQRRKKVAQFALKKQKNRSHTYYGFYEK